MNNNKNFTLHHAETHPSTPLSTLPTESGLTEQDVLEIGDLLQAAILDAVGHSPFIGSVTLDWQNEDQTAIQRIARLDIGRTCIDSLPPREQYPERIAADIWNKIDNLLCLVSTIHIADALGQTLVHAEDLLQGLPRELSHAHNRTWLWAGHGTLIMTILSTLPRLKDGFEPSVELVVDVQGRMQECEVFENCREFDSDLEPHWADTHSKRQQLYEAIRHTEQEAPELPVKQVTNERAFSEELRSVITLLFEKYTK